MAAAIPVIADIVVSAVVSKVASTVITEVASGLGASDKTAAMLGGIAGLAAGAYTYGMAGDAINASSQAGQLASQTAEFGEAGQALTSEALTTSGTTAAAGAANKSLMSNYVAKPTAMINQPSAINMPTQAVSSSASSSASVGSDVIDKAAKEPWYKTMWDGDMASKTAAGFVQGATGAILQADAAEDAYGRKRKDQLEDDKRKEWKTGVTVDGLSAYRQNSGYQPKYVKRSNRPLMQRGVPA